MLRCIHTLIPLALAIISPTHQELWLTLSVTSQNEKTTLLGKTKQDYASILKWMSFANGEITPKLGDWFGPVTGQVQYNKRNVDDAQAASLARLKVLEDYLHVNTYLVGERLTLADIFTATLLLRGFQYFFDKKWRQEYPSLTRWYDTIRHQPIYADVLPKVDFIDEAVKYTPPKKEPKKEAPKKEAPKKEAKPKEEDPEEEEAEKPAPKPKHPLDLLPRSAYVLDDWKRKYSNEETPAAMKWFWENTPFDEWSLWRADYKYNNTLKLTFMSSNLIGE
jgi:elongation factor 1-gamma